MHNALFCLCFKVFRPHKPCEYHIVLGGGASSAHHWNRDGQFMGQSKAQHRTDGAA